MEKRQAQQLKNRQSNNNSSNNKETVNQESEKKPVISVIMPAYQAAPYIRQAVDSVLRQTCTETWELLMIDDGSSDQTPEIAGDYAKDPRIRYIRRKKNRGVAAARNLGIQKARGEYVAFLDADDWWDADKLKLQMACMAQTGAVLCCTGRELMHKDGKPSGKSIGVPEKITYKMLLRTNVIPCGSVVLRKDVAQEFGFVCDKYHEDYILWLRILKKYHSAAGVNVPALKCRLSEGGKSRNKWKSARMQYGSYRYLGYGRLRALYYMIF